MSYCVTLNTPPVDPPAGDDSGDEEEGTGLLTGEVVRRAKITSLDIPPSLLALPL
jgi:hypothetical protein